MTAKARWAGALVAIGLVVSGAATGVAAPASAGAGTVAAATAAACTVPVIAVHKGRREGAAGSRFQTVRVTNLGGQPCATPGWTRYRFFNRRGVLGYRSRRNPGFDPAAAPVVLGAGRTGRSVLSWTAPGAVPRHRCHPRHATGVTVKITGLPGHFILRVDVRVCTTRKYRPRGTRLVP